jgi:hypothetical protein
MSESELTRLQVMSRNYGVGINCNDGWYVYVQAF